MPEFPRFARSTAAPAETGAALFPPLVPLLLDWLPRQRWFAGKDRPIAELSLTSAAELFPGVLHLLVRVRQPGPGSEGCYQLLLGAQRPLSPALSRALIGTPDGGPLGGLAVYDALRDPRLASLLLERLRRPGRLGGIAFVRETGAGSRGTPGTVPPQPARPLPPQSIPSGLPARRLEAEQSNSSVVYGDRFILKVFRRVHPGPNPDLELPAALARAGSRRVPPPAAWFETSVLADDDGRPATLGVLQPFLAGADDGWRLALDGLAARADFAPHARALGRATAEVHESLAGALPTTVLRRPQAELLAAAMAERLEAAAAAVPALHPYRDRLAEAFAAVAELGRSGRTWRAQRVHGDLHLGQTLRTARNGYWSFIDFEGEPEVPLPERRRPQPVTRDVAGMLRSFDYAAASGGAPPSWADRCGAEYCAGYAETAGADPREEPELLRAYLTDKAVYEVVYEARNRPDWLDVPLAAVRRLTG